MIWMAFVVLFGTDNKEFFDMVEERQAKGHTWHYVGRTVVDDTMLALPVIEQDGTEVIYWKIKE